jgi:hypothetical protein
VGSLERRLAALEASSLGPLAPAVAESWPIEEQVEDALCYLAVHVRWGSVAAMTDRELQCIALVEDLPEEVIRKHVSRLIPRLQPERERWLISERGHWIREWEDLEARRAERQEERKRRAEESKTEPPQ